MAEEPKTYPPGLTREEYVDWMVAAFHDAVWQNMLAALYLSTEEYTKQVLEKTGSAGLTSTIASIILYIRRFEQDSGSGVANDANKKCHAMFCDAEKRLRAVVRYCLENDAFPKADMGGSTGILPHPTAADQTVKRDDAGEIVGMKTVYIFK